MFLKTPSSDSCLGTKGLKIPKQTNSNCCHLWLSQRKANCSEIPSWHCEERRRLQRHTTQKQPSQRHGDCLSCHSNLCSIWCSSVHDCVVVLIKANRLAHEQLVRYHYGDCSSEEAFPSGEHGGINIAAESRLGAIEQPPPQKRMLPASLYCCFNNLHSNVISKLASIVSYGLLCAIKLDSILSKSSVVWEPMPAKVMC